MGKRRWDDAGHEFSSCDTVNTTLSSKKLKLPAATSATSATSATLTTLATLATSATSANDQHDIPNFVYDLSLTACLDNDDNKNKNNHLSENRRVDAQALAAPTVPASHDAQVHHQHVGPWKTKDVVDALWGGPNIHHRLKNATAKRSYNLSWKPVQRCSRPMPCAYRRIPHLQATACCVPDDSTHVLSNQSFSSRLTEPTSLNLCAHAGSTMDATAQNCQVWKKSALASTLAQKPDGTGTIMDHLCRLAPVRSWFCQWMLVHIQATGATGVKVYHHLLKECLALAHSMQTGLAWLWTCLLAWALYTWHVVCGVVCFVCQQLVQTLVSYAYSLHATLNIVRCVNVTTSMFLLYWPIAAVCLLVWTMFCVGGPLVHEAWHVYQVNLLMHKQRQAGGL